MMTLPEFLKRNPDPRDLDEPPVLGNNPDEATIASASEGWKAIQKLGIEINNLRRERDRLITTNTQSGLRIEHLERELAQATARAAHYERFTTEIVTQFNTLRMIVDDIQRKATDVAYRRIPGTPPIARGEPLTADEQARLANLVEALKPEQSPEVIERITPKVRPEPPLHEDQIGEIPERKPQ